MDNDILISNVHMSYTIIISYTIPDMKCADIDIGGYCNQYNIYTIPVVVPHPNKHASFSFFKLNIFGLIFATDISGNTVYWENVLVPYNYLQFTILHIPYHRCYNYTIYYNSTIVYNLINILTPKFIHICTDIYNTCL